MRKIFSEKYLEKELTKALASRYGCMSIKLISNVSGLPDRLTLSPVGVAFFIEYKTTGCKPRPLQIYQHDKLRRLGFKVFIVDSIETFNEVIDYVRDICSKDIPAEDH